MEKLPDNVRLEYETSHEIANCRWDEKAQMYRVTVDGQDYQSYLTSDQMRGIVQNRRRAVAAFEAMARCAEARENREKAEDERRLSHRVEVMAEVGYIGTADGAYRLLGRDNPTAQRAVDLAVEARMKLEEQGEQA